MAQQLKPEDMVKVRALAPFEIAEAIALWTAEDANEPEAYDGLNGARLEAAVLERCRGLGPARKTMFETDRQYGERVATAIVHYLKEI